MYQTPDGLMEVRIQNVEFTKQKKDGETIHHKSRIISYVDVKKNASSYRCLPTIWSLIPKKLWKNRSRLGQCAGADWDTFDAAKLMIFSETVAF